MWIWLLKVALPGVGGFLKQYWKVLAVAAALGFVFYAGTQYQESKHTAELVVLADEKAKAIAARERELREEHRLQQEHEAEARMVLQDDLEALRAREKDLIEGIRAAQLIKPPSDLVCEAIQEIDGETTVIVANPFSPSFRLHWNAASNAPSATRTD